MKLSKKASLVGLLILAVVPGSFIIFIGMVLYRKYLSRTKNKKKLRIVK